MPTEWMNGYSKHNRQIRTWSVACKWAAVKPYGTLLCPKRPHESYFRIPWPW
jgi:hypothetical protein